MATCDIAGCDDKAVAAILLTERDLAKRCPACMEWEGENEGWW